MSELDLSPKAQSETLIVKLYDVMSQLRTLAFRVGPNTPQGRELDNLSRGISASVRQYDMANPFKAKILYENSRSAS